MISSLLVLLASAFAVNAASRTSPPSGAYVVGSGQKYSTISAAVSALPNNGTSIVIFIYPGTYDEQVYINTADSVTIYGYTENTATYESNQVNVVVSLGASETGSDDTTGTIRVHSDNVKLYNLNVYNDWYLSGNAQSQALALSAYGSNFGAYACSFVSYQDTVNAESGNQVYLSNYIEGAVDFIWGQHARAWFQNNDIVVSNAGGTITAAGPSDSSDPELYVFQTNTVYGTSTVPNNSVYYGRPWSEYARVVFLNTDIATILNSALWEEWGATDPNTEFVFFADYNTQGPGATGLVRPSFATLLTESQAAEYTISYVLGSNYSDWVDSSYL